MFALLRVNICVGKITFEKKKSLALFSGDLIMNVSGGNLKAQLSQF